MVKGSPPLQQSHLLHVLSGSYHRGASALKHILWSCFWPESGKRLVQVAWLCSAVTCTYWPHLRIAHVSALSWPILQATCFSASSLGFWNLSYNPWLLAVGFRIIFSFIAFQIVQRSCWNSWLVFRSVIKMSWNIHILCSFLFVAEQADCCLPELLFPCRDPGDAGKGLSKDLCLGRTGNRSVHPAASSDKRCGEKHCLCLFALGGQGDIYRERGRKAQFKYI